MKKLALAKFTTMKKISLLMGCILTTFMTFAQVGTANDYVKGFTKIPPFSINLVPDSSYFTNANLKKDKPLMVMFFSPDCDHCQKQTKDILAYKNELKDVQILMISVLPNKFNLPFFEEYQLAKVQNIKLGTDLTYKLRQVYQVKTLPAMYVYDVNGNLAKAFVGNVNVPSIIDAVK